MPETWKLFSKEIFGRVEEQTEINEEYVATKMIQKYLNQGLTPSEIALKWNQGSHKKPCSSGTNSMGVEYDSCTYVAKVVKALTN